MSKEKIPTLEDWKKDIYDDFMKNAYVRTRLTEEEAKKYLFDDGYVERMYERAKAKYEAGEIPIGVFRVGEPSAIAYDLGMSF